MASVQKGEFGQDLTGVKRSNTHIHLFLTYQKAARTAALPAVMLKIFGYLLHFEEVAKPLLVSPGIRNSATTGKKKGTTVGGEYTSCLLFTLQHTTKQQQLFPKKARHWQYIYMALHDRIRNSLSILL